MNSFSIKRFWKTMRWVLAVNFRSLLMWTTGAALVAFLGEMIVWAMTRYGDPDSLIREYVAMDSAIFVIAVIIMISMVVSSINEKRKREAFLMLPSSNLEKYLSLVVYTSVICVLCVFLALVVGDSLRIAWFWGRETFASVPYAEDIQSVCTNSDGHNVYWYSSAIPKLLENLFSGMIPSFDERGMMIYTIPYKVCSSIVIVGLLTWIHSTYILGGTLLRKYAFVLSSLVIILAFLLLAWLIHKFNLNVFYTETLVDGQSLEALRQSGALDTDGELPAESVQVIHKVGPLGYIVTVVLPIISIFNYWASYRIFKGFQLISNKWTNYDILKR